MAKMLHISQNSPNGNDAMGQRNRAGWVQTLGFAILNLKI